MKLVAIIALAICATVPIATPATAQHMNALEGPCADVTVTSDLTACLGVAYRQANLELNAVYKKTMIYTDKRDHGLLRDTQDKWVAYRDTACEAEAAAYREHSGKEPARLACLVALTRAQTSFLNTAFGWQIENFRP